MAVIPWADFQNACRYLPGLAARGGGVSFHRRSARMLHKCLKALAVLLVAAVVPLAAQDAVLHGTVTSDRGDVVQVAAVQLPELNMQVLTGANGQYVFVIPGARVRGQTLTLRVRSIGHKPGSKV